MPEIKRIHYYDYQYLLEPDFTAEQKYHKDMRRMHNKSLHTSGIVNGLDISIESDTEIKISAGIAIDSHGNEMVLDSPEIRSLTISAGENGQRYVSITYHEEQTDPPPDEFKISDTDRTRWTESVIFDITENPLSDTGLNIILGKIIIESGKITKIDDSDRRYSGACGEGRFSKVGIGTTDPQAPLDVDGNTKINGSLRVSGDQLIDGNVGIANNDLDHPLVVGPKKGGRHLVINDIATARWGFATGSYKLAIQNDGSGKWETRMVLTKDGNMDMNGSIKATTVRMSNPMVHRMYPADPLVYQNIFDAKTAGAISKLGNPKYYNDTSYKNGWNGRPIIAYGGNNETDGNGAQVIIPDGYDTVWVRVLGERWNAIKASFLDGSKENLGIWTGGHRNANCYCPDGSLTDSHQNKHQWLPIPAGRSGKLALITKPNTNSHFWISGLAFSRNPWKHAAQSAVGIHWAVNGGDKVAWHTHNWNNDVLARIEKGKKWKLMIPVVPSGRDKLLYLIDHDNNWNCCMHNGITVNGNPIERFLASYDNPFARHWSSKIYERYIAALIPHHVITGNARYLTVQIDMTKQDNHIHFREMGTHDLEIPDPY